MERCDLLRHRLAVLKEKGADGFDPARWRYIASLLQRAGKKQGNVREQIARIALTALDDYQSRFDREQAKSADIMARAASAYPDATQQLQRLFEESNFKAFRRLVERLRLRHRQGLLLALTRHIEKNARAWEKEKTLLAFDDLLYQQEVDVLQSLGHAVAFEDAPSSSPNEAGSKPFRFFKKTLATLNSERLVARAIKERPENAGPLNSQLLATRSLFIMRRLSPNYLNRFVSYIDTLLWLEQAGEEIKPRTDKKRNRSRSK
ncbi:MAG: DUF2894 domain-containing protein [Desulfobacterales bacterium]|jgi:hypothetical protein|nr:DUF2894 domain-containing protein [Desulfobacterales bacterium]